MRDAIAKRLAVEVTQEGSKDLYSLPRKRWLRSICTQTSAECESGVFEDESMAQKCRSASSANFRPITLVSTIHAYSPPKDSPELVQDT